jgi:predicted acylesterase/phospholipase RssA
MPKSIHFILPGGGLRGSFQAGFMYKILSDYRDDFTIYRIDGTSVGSINGIASILGNIEALKEIWLSISSINDFFGSWSENPIIGQLLSIYRGFYNNGAYNNLTLRDKLINHLDDRKDNIDKNILSKFSCVVTNMNNARLEYISGTHPLILEYVTASASPWIVTNPHLIEGELYSDGCLLETYPIKYVKDSKADLIIIVGFDQEHVNFVKPDCSNMLTYLAALIDIARFNSTNNKDTINLIKEGKCIPIVNTMNVLFTNFTHEDIEEGFNHGMESAEQFAKTYLDNC